MNVKIDLNNDDSYINITDNIDASSLQIQERCDESFAMGKCTAWFSGETYKYNIPSYTKMMIDNVYYACKSKCTHYITKENLYIHEFDILDAAAFLSCFRVGTKVFSNRGTNTSDLDKINVLFALMQQKYNIQFSATNTTLINGSKDYQFSDKSTLFDCINEIAGQYGLKVEVSSINSLAITINFIDLNSEVYVPTKVMNVEYTQDFDTYGKTIECEAKNVVDRTTLTYVDDLTVRADDVLLNTDTAKLYLPSGIESVVDFGMNVSMLNPRITIDCSGANLGSFKNYDGTTTYRNLAQTIRYYGEIDEGDTGFLFEDIYKHFFKDRINISKTEFYNSTWEVYGNGLIGRGVGTYNYSDTLDFGIKQSLIGSLLEKKQWDLLNSQDQTSYAVYTSGSNVIDNLNASYKNDLWNTLLGMNRNNFLNSLTAYKFKSYNISLNSNEYVNKLKYANYFKWYIKYYAITNLILIDEKEDPLNEDSFKNFTRNYNVASGSVDFDKVANNMHISNNTLGRPEMALEIDVTGATHPKAKQKLIYDNNLWYISSVIKTYNSSGTTCILNCVYDYNKKAESVQTDTEYISTKLSLDYIDRPIFIKNSFNTSNTYNTSKTIYFRFYFHFNNDSTVDLECIVPAARMEKDGTYYFICEMLDNVFVNSYAKYDDSIFNGNKELKYVNYVNKYNECFKAEVQMVQIGDLTIDQSYNLPNYDGVSITQLTSRKSVILYKDAKERLTFTMKIES